MLDDLDREDRLRLLRFVCSFAWADLEIRDEERAYVASLVERLGLAPGEALLVRSWLTRPPAPEDVDPLQIPAEHRQVFLDAVRGLMSADGELSPEELETFNLLSQLVGGARAHGGSA